MFNLNGVIGFNSRLNSIVFDYYLNLFGIDNNFYKFVFFKKYSYFGLIN